MEDTGNKFIQVHFFPSRCYHSFSFSLLVIRTSLPLELQPLSSLKQRASTNLEKPATSTSSLLAAQTRARSETLQCCSQRRRPSTRLGSRATSFSPHQAS